MECGNWIQPLRKSSLAEWTHAEWPDDQLHHAHLSDLPHIRVFFEELGNVHGAYGAKGIGELPMDGPAPAIVNAVVDALRRFL